MLCTSLTFAQTNISETVNSAQETTKNLKETVNTLKDLKVKTPTFNQQPNNFVNGVSTVYNDTKSLTGTVYNDFKDAAKNITPKIESAIQEIAKGLKVGTVYVWNILVKQQRVWSWCYLIGMIISLIVWYKFYSFIKEGKTDLNEYDQWKSHNVIMSVILFFTASILSFISFQHVVPMMTGFLNPEFGAIQTVIEFAKTLK